MIAGVEIDRVHLWSSSDFAYGARVGVDLPFGSGPWSFRSSVLYLASDLEVKNPEGERTRLDFDPLIVSAGIGYRF